MDGNKPALLFIVLGVIIGWLARKSAHLSSSGRDPREIGDAYWDNNYHV